MADSEQRPEDVSPTRLPRISTENDSPLSDVMSQIVNLSEDNIMHEPTCPICCSSFRDEYERIHLDEGQTYQDVSKLAKEKEGKKLNKDIIRNHMSNHAEGGARELKKVEYIDRIKRLKSQPTNTMEQLGFGMSIVLERLVAVNSITEDGEHTQADVEKIKSSETNKLMGTYHKLLNMQASIMGEMQKDGEMISIPRDDFIKIFSEAITNSKTELEKNTIQNILNKLREIGVS